VKSLEAVRRAIASVHVAGGAALTLVAERGGKVKVSRRQVRSG
jgi:hypothetical protein